MLLFNLTVIICFIFQFPPVVLKHLVTYYKFRAQFCGRFLSKKAHFPVVKFEVYRIPFSLKERSAFSFDNLHLALYRSDVQFCLLMCAECYMHTDNFFICILLTYTPFTPTKHVKSGLTK